MSEENVEQYQRMAEAFERRDLDAFLMGFDHDVEFAPRSVQADGGTSYRGHHGIRRWWESMFSVFSDYQAEVEEVQDLGDLMLARARLRGQGMESGAPIEQTQWHVIEWRHGKVVRWRTFGSETQAHEAAEQSE